MAFPGLKNGEQECDVFFCTVHVMRTWMSKIYEKKTRQKMLHAMHKRTRIGCESLIQEAINECANLTIKKYILRNYAKNTHQWALWARQHSPLLLQVTSTNALESYHSELKMTTSPKHGLIGACNNIVVLDDKKQTDSECVAYEFRTKKSLSLRMFDETGFDVYMHREIDLNVPVSRLTEAENAIVNRRQSVSELMERIRDTYWRVKERGNAEQTGVFIEELKGCLEPILNNK
uniref:MULE transposase domain-containing protein n=1 Tax=Rhizophagus irregularis (strain DAOM 181602 / DAOM 197198 / MUCL 43194) TaxID=747089 RepID=U9U8P1_RHIID